MKTHEPARLITDEMLGAYVDGELDAASRAQVEAALLRDDSVGERLKSIEDLNRLVKAATYRDRPVAEAAATPRQRATQPTWMNWQLAASFVAGALAVALATSFTPTDSPPQAHGWQQSALAFHSSYLLARADGRSHILIDVPDPTAEESVNVYAPLIDYEPMLPDLSMHDYSPKGTRLVTSPDGPQVFVVYEAPGRAPVGFSVIRATPSHSATPTSTSWQNVRLVSWSDGEFEYALSAEMPDDTLDSLATTARQSLSREAPHEL